MSRTFSLSGVFCSDVRFYNIYGATTCSMFSRKPAKYLQQFVHVSLRLSTNPIWTEQQRQKCRQLTIFSGIEGQNSVACQQQNQSC